MERADRPTVHCPEFLPGFTWINTRRPLTVAGDLRGRIAVLDFWTYCCINCMHVLPVLKRIEERFAKQPVAVIGVHSAKFISERDPENIRRAVQRYDVAHPVVVDRDHDMWERFGVRAWPTLVLVDAGGYVRDTLAGEISEEDLTARIEGLLKEGRDQNILAAGPLDVAPDPQTDSTFLRFPGKVHVHRGLLYIADSGHNRIVVAGLDGRVEAVVGEGGPGARDGRGDQASFHNPQGLAVGTLPEGGERLYVADTGNHLLRGVDPTTLEVTTVAGTGGKGETAGVPDLSDLRKVPLRSPWGLLSIGHHILIAMAGSHQIWLFDPERGMIGPWAGSGQEDHLDGTLQDAALAQPSGLARAGRFLFIADSEVSSIRAIDLDSGAVQTVVGQGLFDFGDSDGAPQQVLLQHPLDVTAGDNVLYVADTYNNKIKEIAFGSMLTRVVFGDGRPATMHEPGGVAVANGSVIIADTNNHRLLRGDPATGALEEFPLSAPA